MCESAVSAHSFAVLSALAQCPWPSARSRPFKGGKRTANNRHILSMLKANRTNKWGGHFETKGTVLDYRNTVPSMAKVTQSPSSSQPTAAERGRKGGEDFEWFRGPPQLKC
ncbi:hypothetical protein niasHS_002130 [Heterodera schachtii]|uniref:Uncharacterized protein n=1 Tax=Heterodera schachtii TaxID=97005 RepID=A0ABD2KMH9_HETSC